MEGDCHFLSGNIRAKKRLQLVQGILKELGMEPERLDMFNLSASMGPRFAEIATEMTNRIHQLGPSPIRKRIEEGLVTLKGDMAGSISKGEENDRSSAQADRLHSKNG